MNQKNNSNTSWPYIPECIVENEKLPGCIPDDQRIGLQSRIALTIDLPVSLFEFDSDRRIKRLDPPHLHFHVMCRYCRKRRLPKDEYSNEDEYSKFCSRSEMQYVALINMTDIKEFTEVKILANYEQSDKIENSWSDEDIKPQYKTVGDRSYIEYRCPTVGFVKAVFPIIIEGKILGVLMTGQINMDNELHNRLKKDDFYKDKLTDRDHDLITVDERMKFYTQSDYDKKIKAIIGIVKLVEKELQESIEKKRNDIVMAHIGSIVSKFKSALNQPQDMSIESIGDTFWKAVRKLVENIVQAFKFSYYIIYADDAPFPVSEDALTKKICYSEREEIQKSFPENIPKDKLKTIRETCIVSSKDDAEDVASILSISRETLRDDFRLVLIESPGGGGAILIVVGYSEACPIDHEINRPGGVLSEGFKHVNNALSLAYTAMMSRRNAAVYTLYMRYQNHEIGQLATGIDGIRHHYIDAMIDDPKKKLTPGNWNDIRNDFNGFTHQIAIIHDTSKSQFIFDKDYKPLMKYIEPYGQLLYKWRNSFLRRCEEKQVRIPSLWSGFDREKCPPIRGNFELLEQIVYNLITNAIKYSHRGSNIHIEWKDDPSEEKYTVFTVTDYGCSIANIDIYGIYIKSTQLSGSGFGLYIAKKVAQLHGGDLSDNREADPVSKFNIPLLAALEYVVMDNPANIYKIGEDDWARYREEIQRLRNEGLLKEIVAMRPDKRPLYIPSPMGSNSPLAVKTISFKRLKKLIKDATYKVVFTARIPRI